MRRDLVSHVQGKVVYYRSDGTGRDSYIKNNNGGLLSHDAVYSLRLQPQKTKARMAFGKTGQKSLSSRVENKFPHYISDGSGRDFYITHNEGGNSSLFGWRDQVDFSFKQELRNYRKVNRINPENQDTFALSQMKMTKTETFRNRTLSQIQFNQSIRLSRPKMVKQLPPVQTYFPNFYNTKRDQRLCEKLEQ